MRRRVTKAGSGHIETIRFDWNITEVLNTMNRQLSPCPVVQCAIPNAISRAIARGRSKACCRYGTKGISILSTHHMDHYPISLCLKVFQSRARYSPFNKASSIALFSSKLATNINIFINFRFSIKLSVLSLNTCPFELGTFLIPLATSSSTFLLVLLLVFVERCNRPTPSTILNPIYPLTPLAMSVSMSFPLAGKMAG